MQIEEWLGADYKLGIDIWQQKYRDGEESFDEWLVRVSGNNKELADTILQKKFIFAGRILANRGLIKKHNKKLTYSNCYVITPPSDNIESIFETSAKLARTYSYGGGCGIDISELRPAHARVNNAAVTTSGAISFMDLFSKVTEVIGQKGRRGALMISISCEHPDMPEFIGIKKDLDKVTRANISIRFTDAFMKAVEDGNDIDLTFTANGSSGKEVISRRINAREVFIKFAEANWQMAEPGALFWDRINDWNLLSNNPKFRYSGVNPCAEEPLPAGGSCLLGSINLSEFVKKDKGFDSDEFCKTVDIAVKALNDVLDEGLNFHPLKEQRDSVRDWRQIGLGIMGLGDMLIKMEIEYGSKESLELCDIIGRLMINQACKTSALLAKEYGAYPLMESNIAETHFAQSNLTSEVLELIKQYGLRNSQILTTAPTGSLSTMLGVSGGIEPIFAKYYTRTTKSLYNEDKAYKVFTPIVKEYMDANGISEDKADSSLPKYFITAPEIDYSRRIQMQGTWQKYIDASISSTVNLPEKTTVEDVLNIYLEAWRNGLKGITIYRDNCERKPILKKEEKASAQTAKIESTSIPSSDKDMIWKKKNITSGCGSLHCCAGFDGKNGNLVEIFLLKGSDGGCNNFMNGLSRMISIAARHGVNISSIVDQLKSAGVCPSYAVRRAMKKDTSQGSSCPTAIGYALTEMYEEVLSELNLRKKIKEEKLDDNSPKCPECGEKLTHEGGCDLCHSCGWTHCQ